jgi:NhaP-type Na+/H+ or K+/H+ antiporter
MTFTLWHLIIGALLMVTALTGSLLRRLPVTTSMVYLTVGFALGPTGGGLIRLDPLQHAEILQHVIEVALAVSLFTAGLKLREPLSEARWRLPVRLAVGTMVLTVGFVALAGVLGLDLPLGAAVLLGAILAPTDPVLASDVQVEHPFDRDRLRFSLTGEAGLNDGTTLPFVMLGLGLLGLHEIGEGGWRWLAIDVGWAVTGGLAIGGLLGTLVAHLVLYLRREHKEAVGWDDFLGLGLVALAYGLALLAHTDGFLAVFAAGLGLRQTEQRFTGPRPARPAAVALAEDQREAVEEKIATEPETGPAYMAQAVLGFNEQLERIGEVAVIVLLGGMLSSVTLPSDALWFFPLLFLVTRPAAVMLGLIGARTVRAQRPLIAWFGVRGIGSLYHLMFALRYDLPPDLARLLTGLTLATVAVSIVIHGVSVTPVMRLYERRTSQGKPVPST